MAESNKQKPTARKTKDQILDEVVEKAHQQKQKKKKPTQHQEYRPKHYGQNKRPNQQKQTTKPKQVVKTIPKQTKPVANQQPKKEVVKVENKQTVKKEETKTTVKKETKPVIKEEVKKVESKQEVKVEEQIKKERKRVEDDLIEQKELVSQIAEKLKEEEKKIEEIKAKEETKIEEHKQEEQKRKVKLKNARKKKFRASVNIISLIIGILFLLSMATMFGLVTYLNILPAKFFIPFTILTALFTLLVSFMLFNFKIKKGIKIFFSVLGILVVAVSAVVLNYAIHTFDFLKDISNADLKITEKYYVMVKADSPYNKLEDIATFTVGTFNENTNIYQEAIKQLTEKVEVTLVECDSSIQNVDNLLSGESTAILLSNLHKEQYQEENKGFSDKVKILATIEVETNHKENEVVTIKPVSEDVMTIYISGIDTYGGINLRSRSDVNMLVTVNKKNHEILLTSIPRDYYVQLHDTYGYKDKLTHAGIYGVNMSVQTIQDFMGIDINYYVRVNFSTLEAVVNSIGGVDVYSDLTFRPLHHKAVVIKQGMNHMDGKTALAFARERYAYQDGDRHRVRNQQEVLKAIISKATSDVSILTRYTTLLNNVSGYFQTNVDMNEVAKIVKIQLDEMPSWTIKQYSLDGTGSKQPTHSMGATPLYVMIPNQDTVNTGSRYINGMTKGKTFKELGLN